MKSMSKRVYWGVSHLLEGGRLIVTEKTIRKWAIIPFLIDILLVISGIGFGLASISGWVTSALAFVGLAGGGFIASIFFYLFSAVLWIGYLIVVIYGTFLVATVVAAPFNSLLAERTLMHLGVIEEKPFKLGAWISTSLKLLVIGLIKSLIFAFLGIFIFITSFIPVLNFVSSYLALLIMSFDSMDYSFEAREFGLKKRFRYFQTKFPEFTGMAGGLALTILVPGLTLLVLPCSVVGAAIIMKNQPD